MGRSLILRARRLALGPRIALAAVAFLALIGAFVGGLYVLAWLWGVA